MSRYFLSAFTVPSKLINPPHMLKPINFFKSVQNVMLMINRVKSEIKLQICRPHSCGANACRRMWDKSAEGVKRLDWFCLLRKVYITLSADMENALLCLSTFQTETKEFVSCQYLLGKWFFIEIPGVLFHTSMPQNTWYWGVNEKL